MNKLYGSCSWLSSFWPPPPPQIVCVDLAWAPCCGLAVLFFIFQLQTANDFVRKEQSPPLTFNCINSIYLKDNGPYYRTRFRTSDQNKQQTALAYSLYYCIWNHVHIIWSVGSCYFKLASLINFSTYTKKTRSRIDEPQRIFIRQQSVSSVTAHCNTHSTQHICQYTSSNPRERCYHRQKMAIHASGLSEYKHFI
jgi:hypothetical protein